MKQDKNALLLVRRPLRVAQKSRFGFRCRKAQRDLRDTSVTFKNPISFRTTALASRASHRAHASFVTWLFNLLATDFFIFKF